VKGADGYQYWLDGPQQGERVLPGVANPDIAENAAKAAMPNVEGETNLRKEWTKVNEEFRDQNAAYGRIKASAKNHSAAGDLALIFNYMKMLDPGSTVREGEFATAQNAAGVDQRAAGLYNRILNGERMSQEQRGDFVNRADMLMGDAKETYSQLKGQYVETAKAYGYDTSRVLTDFNTKRQPIRSQQKTGGTTAETRPGRSAKSLETENRVRASKRGW